MDAFLSRGFRTHAPVAASQFLLPQCSSKPRPAEVKKPMLSELKKLKASLQNVRDNLQTACDHDEASMMQDFTSVLHMHAYMCMCICIVWLEVLRHSNL